MIMGKGTTKFVAILFVLILGGVGWLGWQVYSTYQIANRIIDRDSRMMVLRSEIIRLDEMLTWLVRAGAQTGDYRYVDRYNELLQVLDDAIVEAMNLSPPTVREAVEQKTSIAKKRRSHRGKKNCFRSGIRHAKEDLCTGYGCAKQVCG
jgi:twitching motility protein PilJ